MTSTQPVWISPQAYERLRQELATLRQLTTAAATDGDSDENTTAVYRTWRARIQQIHDTVGEDPPDDGIAEPGMVLTIRYDDTGDTETFLLGVRGAEHGDRRSTRTDRRWAPRSQAHAPANNASTPCPAAPA